MKQQHYGRRALRWLGIGSAAFLLSVLGLVFLAFAFAGLVEGEVVPAVFVAAPGLFFCKWTIELFKYCRKVARPALFAHSGGKPVRPLAVRILLGIGGMILGLLGVCGIFGFRDPILLALLPLLFVGLYLLRLAEERTPVELSWLGTDFEE